MLNDDEKISRTGFDLVAPYYDELMSHVNYPGWVREARHVARCLDGGPFRLLDLACGTATFAVGLARETDWQIVGLDSSVEMIRCGRKKLGGCHTVQLLVADMRCPPVRSGFDMVVSLFDSVNFIMTAEGLDELFRQVHELLVPDGIFFFDVITERNVRRNFEGEPWSQPVAGTTCRWSSTYDTDRRVVYTTLDIRAVGTITVVERIYSDARIREMLADAGFELVAALEAHTWDEPNPASERIEYIVCRGQADRYRAALPAIRERYRNSLPVR